MNDACIALLSDFGSRDVYAGVMKGVISREAPRARLIDLTHDVPPGDIRRAAFHLWQAFPSMPRGTIFLAVVDPGVGTVRRPIVIRGNGFFCVGPDNGIFTYMLEGRGATSAVQIASPEAKSCTFHGRDLFAPAAALLAAGTDPDELGPSVSDLVSIPWPRLSSQEAEGLIHGEMLFADRFGNMVTSIGVLVSVNAALRWQPWVPGRAPLDVPTARLRVVLGNGMELPLAHTFAEVLAGAPLAYVGSDGLLEIGINRGNASESLKLAPGMEVSLDWR
ncbi:MAG: S-adenosyl-l-methionine hydroxide adenosyltransferase family protein [Spirochaetia bacterium]